MYVAPLEGTLRAPLAKQARRASPPATAGLPAGVAFGAAEDGTNFGAAVLARPSQAWPYCEAQTEQCILDHREPPSTAEHAISSHTGMRALPRTLER